MSGYPMTVERDDDRENRAGFSASLSASSLSDLVQLQCLSGATSVARVMSGENIGYLYFRDGRVVHAMSPSYVGEAAAIEMLSWPFGAFEVCNAGWPERETIQVTFQALLLRAAQHRDESSHHKLLHFPRPAATPTLSSELGAPLIETRDVPPDSRRRATPGTSSEPPQAGPRVQAVVRLDANGTTLVAKGNGASELADSAAFAARLAALIGDALALDALTAIEGTTATQRTLIVKERTGGLVALKATLDADLSAVRERYGI